MNFIAGVFKPPCSVLISLADGRTRKQVPIKKDNGQTVMLPLFQSQETIIGEVLVEPTQGKKFEHNGIKIELLGQIELFFDRGNFYDFTSLVRELDVPGELYERKTYPFEFSSVEMPHESYNGVNVRLRYILKVTIGRNYVPNMVEYQEFVVRNYTPPPPINNSIKMEVGIEDCLHIEFEPDPPPKTTTTTIDTRRKPKYISHESAINLIKRERDPKHALEIFNMVAEQNGFNHNGATYAAILDKLARSKKFEAIDAVLHQMTYETCKFHEGVFLNLMKHFSKSSLHERVLKMFYAIQPYVREKPSLKAISTCLNLLVESNQINLAREFLLHTKKSLNLRPNTCIFNILVKHHCKSRDLESAFEVVNEMKKSKISYPNLITYSTLMDGLCESGRVKEAIDLFEEMVSKDQILPDALTYNILINGFCRGGKVDRAMKVMEFMKSNGCSPNVFNYSALMNGFCKEGRVQEAKELFYEMKSSGLKPDTIGYTTLINCFCRAGKIDEATELLKEMKERECRADTVTFNVILKGLCGEGKFEEALDMLEKLPYDGVYLNKASYRIVLNFLCQKGELKRATELLDLMLGRGFVPHYATSNELLVHLCKANMADDAAIAMFGLVEMGFKPKPDSWAHVLELVCRERRLLSAFELLDELVC